MKKKLAAAALASMALAIFLLAQEKRAIAPNWDASHVNMQMAGQAGWAVKAGRLFDPNWLSQQGLWMTILAGVSAARARCP